MMRLVPILRALRGRALLGGLLALPLAAVALVAPAGRRAPGARHPRHDRDRSRDVPRRRRGARADLADQRREPGHLVYACSAVGPGASDHHARGSRGPTDRQAVGHRDQRPGDEPRRAPDCGMDLGPKTRVDPAEGLGVRAPRAGHLHDPGHPPDLWAVGARRLGIRALEYGHGHNGAIGILERGPLLENATLVALARRRWRDRCGYAGESARAPPSLGATRLGARL